MVACMANWRRNAPLHAPEPRGQGHPLGARLGLDAVVRPAHRLWWLLAEGRTIGDVLSYAVDHRQPGTALPLRSATAGMTKVALGLVPGRAGPATAGQTRQGKEAGIRAPGGPWPSGHLQPQRTQSLTIGFQLAALQ